MPGRLVLAATWGEALEAGEGYEEVPGLAFKRDSELVTTEKPPLVSFDDYPFPARHLVPNENYFSHVSQRKNFTIGLTSESGAVGADGPVYRVQL